MKDNLNKIYSKSCEDYFKLLKGNLKNNKKMFVITANPETIIYAEKDEQVKKMFDDKNVSIVPDGIGVVKAARMLGVNIKERITGVDIAVKLLEYCNDLNKSLYLFGAKQEVIDMMKHVVKEKYPNIKLIGATNGYVKNKDKEMKKIASKKPDVVMVALGIPAQEKLIFSHLDEFEKGILIGVGGSFDVISGMKKRAPQIFIKTNTEWLYRIICEPNRIKRFWNSNVKFLFKIWKMSKKFTAKKVINILFLLSCCFYISCAFLMTIIGQKDVNFYENRTAYKLNIANVDSFLNKEYQNNVELAFADQTPLAIPMKRYYNLISVFTTKNIMEKFLGEQCHDRYVNISNSILTYNCDNIVYYQSYVNDDKKGYDNRINNINKVIEKTNVPIYFYYIEKDTDINFSTNKKSDIFQYLKENINSDNIYNFEINNFNDFNNYFYKTDHHWNYKGSYKAYSELVNILTNDKKVEYNKEICLNSTFSGSKANSGGATSLYKETFCSYLFDLPNYNTTINGEEKTYGNEEEYINNLDKYVSYGDYYGSDNGEIIFDNRDDSKENILIIGESYDNAILKLIASHFNKTYSIDLRTYERENGKNFNYIKYLETNDIDKVLMIGNRDFYRLDSFDLEV